MLTRRRFLGTAAAATSLLGLPPGLQAAAARSAWPPLLADPFATPEVQAQDEAYWQAVQQVFSVDRSLIHLNNGGVCPAPRFVQEAERAHHQASHRHPFYAYQGQVRPQRETIRQGLAACFGCDAGEIALTRNTSEGMEICQLGFALQRGDEVLTTDQDYPRMLNTWSQRAEREGIVIRQIPLPVPLHDPDTLVAQLEAAITPRTRLLMCCHMVDLTGQMLPLKAITAMAHRHGIPVLVDGAQTFGHVPCTASDLGCDFFATSLHKWMMGPQGTGLLFVRKDRIADLWPLMPAGAGQKNDIRKFEDVGTQPPAAFLALGEALSFHRSIGGERKAARLRYLRDYWLDALLPSDRVRLLTHRPAACALATIHVEGLDPLALRNYLWDRHRIRVRPIRHPAVEGIRVSPGIYTTLAELDRFVEVMESILRDGLPS